jgi:hypothetical protein
MVVPNHRYYIRRINYRTACRFSHGTIVTLMFNEPGTHVFDNAHIELKNEEATKTFFIDTNGDGRSNLD